MANFNLFVVNMLGAISSFLMAEPFIYFVGLAMLAFVVQIFKSLCHLSR